MTVRVDPACLVDEPLDVRVRRRLRADLGEEVFTSWFGRLELVDVTGDTARFSVPTKFLKSWIQSHYAERLLRVAAAEAPGTRAVAIEVRGSARPVAARPVLALVAPQSRAATTPAPPVTPTPPPAPPADLRFAGSPLDRRWTFETFVPAGSNAIAHGAALKAADAGGVALFNPLYLHGAAGLGKTHLLHAVAHTAVTAGRRALYLTAERFMYGFVAAIRGMATSDFRERLRDVDILLVDDVQFLQGKSVQQEFCQTLSALLADGKQVVLAADRPPRELESLDERIRSRLGGGLVAEIGASALDLREELLRARVAALRELSPSFTLPDAVVRAVAEAITGSGRAIDGAANRLLAQSSVAGATLTVEAALTAIRDLVQAREPRRVKIEEIQRLVAEHYAVSRADMLSARRTANVVRPRQIAMYLSKVLTLRSLPEIGRRFGGRDHTTVLHAVRKIEGLVGDDKTLGGEVDLLRRMLVED